CRSALRFERVNCCKCRNVDPAGKAAVLNLLAVEFSETDPTAGVVNLIFSGGGMLRREVECLEGEWIDLAPSWPAAARPLHRRPLPAGRPRARRGTRPPPAPPLPGAPARAVREDGAMPTRLDSRAADFAERFRAFLASKRETSADVEAAVRAIIADVAARGDR